MNPLTQLWQFWNDWCDEDATAFAKKTGFIVLIAGIASMVLVVLTKAFVPLPDVVRFAPGFFFLIFIGCCWHVGQKTWTILYVGLVLIVEAGLWLAGSPS